MTECLATGQAREPAEPAQAPRCCLPVGPANRRTTGPGRPVVARDEALTLLFSGPPGVGKTACAEALAHELKRPILVADYSSVLNCFVGQTEKGVVRMFGQARAHNAVLFWDEADAMLYDRSTALYPWNVRSVSVLLQELERFEGVCVLATNRKVALDGALERRIAIKVQFERPDAGMRRRIWGILVPPGMPLADDVDLDELAEQDMTGGEIKNVVLNAARAAVVRGEDSRVTMADFRRAVRMETEARWADGGGSRIGFGHGGYS